MNLWNLAELITALLAVLAPLVGVPLGIITFYLRALREDHRSRHADLARRLDIIESAAAALRENLADVERNYTTKEEWLRELMHARARLEHLAAIAARLQAAEERDRHQEQRETRSPGQPSNPSTESEVHP